MITCILVINKDMQGKIFSNDSRWEPLTDKPDRLDTHEKRVRFQSSHPHPATATSSKAHNTVIQSTFIANCGTWACNPSQRKIVIATATITKSHHGLLPCLSLPCI